MSIFEGVNYLAVLVAAILNMIIGGLWYSPMLFGKQWAEASGMTPEMIEKAKKEGGMGMKYGMMFVITFILAFYLGHFAMHGMDMMEVIKWSLFAWVGLVLTTNVGDVIWGNKSMKLYWINMIQYAVIIVADSILFSLWK
jgi:hypothetical protein